MGRRSADVPLSPWFETSMTKWEKPWRGLCRRAITLLTGRHWYAMRTLGGSDWFKCGRGQPLGGRNVTCWSRGKPSYRLSLLDRRSRLVPEGTEYFHLFFRFTSWTRHTFAHECDFLYILFLNSKSRMSQYWNNYLLSFHLFIIHTIYEFSSIHLV